MWEAVSSTGQLSGFRFRIWDLGFGIWDLGFGIWDLGFGIWDLGFGISSRSAGWCLPAVVWWL